MIKNTEDGASFRILGIGKLSEGQKKRRAKRDEKKNSGRKRIKLKRKGKKEQAEDAKKGFLAGAKKLKDSTKTAEASTKTPTDAKAKASTKTASAGKEDGASAFLWMGKKNKAQKARQKRRGQKKKDKDQFGGGKKGRAAKAAFIAEKAAEAQMNRAGKSMSSSSEGEEKPMDVNSGASMRSRTNMAVPAKKLMKIQYGSSMKDNDYGASMYGKKHGSSMNAYQDKEASMDDYSHEKKLKADGRYEAAHGKMANAKNDFNHAHALKKDAKHDAKGRHSIMKHMRGFK